MGWVEQTVLLPEQPAPMESPVSVESNPSPSLPPAEPVAAPAAISSPPAVFDFLVLGGGSTGREAVRAAAQPGSKVAWVGEGAGTRGPDLDRWGHALWSLAQHLYDLHGAWASLGLPGKLELPIEPAALVRQMLGQAAQPPSPSAEEDWAACAVEIFPEPAVLVGPDCAAVGGRRLGFRRAVIAPDLGPPEPLVPGMDQVGYRSGETLNTLEDLPKRLAILGGGPAACRWAQIFLRLGSEVHLTTPDRSILPDEDAEAAACIAQQLQREGLRLHAGCGESAVQPMGRCKAVLLGCGGEQTKLLVDEIVVFGPPRLAGAGWGLDAAGVAYNNLAVLVDSRLRTTNPRIFAAGGVCGTRWAAPEAVRSMARLAVRNARLPRVLGWLGRKFQAEQIPHRVATDPELFQVGLSPHETAARQDELLVYRDTFPAYQGELEGRAPSRPLSATFPACQGEPSGHGLMKIAVFRRTGRIASITAVGRGASAQAAPLLLLLAHGLPIGAMSLEL